MTDDQREIEANNVPASVPDVPSEAVEPTINSLTRQLMAERHDKLRRRIADSALPPILKGVLDQKVTGVRYDAQGIEQPRIALSEVVSLLIQHGKW